MHCYFLIAMQGASLLGRDFLFMFTTGSHFMSWLHTVRYLNICNIVFLSKLTSAGVKRMRTAGAFFSRVSWLCVLLWVEWRVNYSFNQTVPVDGCLLPLPRHNDTHRCKLGLETLAINNHKQGVTVKIVAALPFFCPSPSSRMRYCWASWFNGCRTKEHGVSYTMLFGPAAVGLQSLLFSPFISYV